MGSILLTPLASSLGDPNFHASFLYSLVLALSTIVLGSLIVVPTAYFVQLRLRRLRPFVEFITLLPLVIPAIVIVFGYLRLYNSSKLASPDQRLWTAQSDVLLAFGCCDRWRCPICIACGRHRVARDRYRKLDRSRGKPWRESGTHPDERHPAQHTGSRAERATFLTFAIVIGEFTFASLLDRPAFGPYLQLIGANRAYEPAALAIIAFAVTWACMGLLNIVGGRPTRTQR